MANNRLFLCCTNCGSSMILDRSYGEQYYISEQKRVDMNRFLEEHAFCRAGRISDGGDFALMDEFDKEDLLEVLHKLKAKENERTILMHEKLEY